MMPSIAQTSSRQIVVTAASMDPASKVITYRGEVGDVTTVGFVATQVSLFGGETLTTESRHVAALLVEDVGQPQRGDRVVTTEGVTWILQEQQETSDEWIAEWTITRR